ncbi:MAG: C40 family peptidase [Candidatus Aquicultorales bacterium]
MDQIERINSALDELKTEYEERYGFAVFDLSVAERGSGVTLSGSVLVKEQKKEALKVARDLSSGQVKADIQVLGDLHLKPLRGWAVAKKTADVWRFLPGTAAAKSLKGKEANRSSQLDAWDYPAKVIEISGGFVLVMIADGTVGWIEEKQITRIPFDGSNYWRDVKRPVAGARLPVSGSVENLAEAALSYVGTPYLWGGATKDGIDCSGLVQRAYYEGVTLMVPKHSREQLRIGERVVKRDITRGDLVFFTVEDTVLHVGITLEDGDFIHASRDEKKVVVEPLREVLAERKFAGARRVVFFDRFPDMPEEPTGDEEFTFFTGEEEF